MTPASVLTLAQQALQVTLLMAAPPLLAALLTGLLVSVFQAATQINEMTLSFIPKLLAIFVALVLFGPWMLGILLDYIRELFTGIPAMIG
ncbi:MAG: flagellar biosynthesis protein FliQ [Betaproteobacteria bacterium]|nr:flagellar biosynthesis protein FliQ [Betaproteobacteria bacterium]